MNKNFKKPKSLKTPVTFAPAVAWDAEFSPLCLYFHYADPARASRILLIGPTGRQVVAETPESIAAYKDFIGIDPATEDACEAGGVLGSAARIRLPWPDALAFLYRAEGSIVPIEKRIPIHFEGEKWVLSGWDALDAGLVRTDLTYEPLSEEEMAAFVSKAGYPSWCTTNIGQIAGIVMAQYDSDLTQLAAERPARANELQRVLHEWIKPALNSLASTTQEPAKMTISSVKLFQRAYEMMAYDYSSVDPVKHVEPQFCAEDIADAIRLYESLKHKTLAKEDAPAFMVGMLAGQEYAHTKECQLDEVKLRMAEKNGTLADLTIALRIPAVEPQAIAREGFMSGMVYEQMQIAKAEAAEPPTELPKAGDHAVFCGHLEGSGIAIVRCAPISVTKNGTEHSITLAAMCEQCYLAGVSHSTFTEGLILTEKMLEHVLPG